jgi:dinuclear metal center YbgI/SA1388 family protein
MAKSILRDDLVAHLDQYLRVNEITDASPNGLQVQGSDRVSRIAYAVDASLQTIRAAHRARASFLVVHHGLWWGRHEQIVGNLHRRVSALIRSGVSLYTAHLPLDCHPEVGNNVELARLLGLRVEVPFGEYKGTRVGVIASLKRTRKRDAFVADVEAALGAPADVLPFGSGTVRRIAIVSGGGAPFTEESARAGCDTLLTGETSHAAFHSAREAGINVVFAGHYASETVGLKALDRHVTSRFGVPGTFVSAPTGF